MARNRSAFRSAVARVAARSSAKTACRPVDAEQPAVRDHAFGDQRRHVQVAPPPASTAFGVRRGARPPGSEATLRDSIPSRSIHQ